MKEHWINTMSKYRSKFEENVAEILPPWWEYEKHRYPYIVERKYVPDFVNEGDGNGVKDTWIEVKGYFRAGDVAKYKAVAKCNPDIRLVFVFSNPLKKVRKGAKLTMGEWAVKNGWEYTTLKELDEFFT